MAKFAVASWGSRGEVEPLAAVANELQRRGHDVRMAVAPDLVGFAEGAGLTATPYGPKLQDIINPYRDFFTCLFRRPWRIRKLMELGLESSRPMFKYRQDANAALVALAEGADLLLTGVNYEDIAVNVAEYHDIPLTTLHWFPLRPNGSLVPWLPGPLIRSAMTLFGRLAWRAMLKRTENRQRRQLGLPKATAPWECRIAERGWMEIQAYDEVCFPGLAAEWAQSNGRRPFVGALTLESATVDDEEVASWIAAGTPPIFFGFGSMPVESPAATLAMVGAVCARLDVRALVCGADTDFGNIAHGKNVKVVATVNYAAIFPACRAVVHHGGAGTTAIGLRAGVPTLVLSTDLFQALWGTTIKRMKVGTARRFSATTEQSLVADLGVVLDPQCAIRARALSLRMTKAAESVAAAADLLEESGIRRR